MMRKTCSFLKANYFSIFSRLIAVYFIWVFHRHVGFPPTEQLTYTSTTYLTLFIFFLVLPFTQRIKLGKLIEFEARVEQVQADIKEVRTETRELISTVSIMANTISNSINQSIVVNLPGTEEAQVAREDLSEVLTQEPEATVQEKERLDYIETGDSNMHYALVRLRADLERELRRILDKHLESEYSSKMRARFLSARSLFRRLVSVSSRYEKMQNSFRYLLRVCDAAAHGQRVPDDIAREAIDMGLRMLRELESEVEL